MVKFKAGKINIMPKSVGAVPQEGSGDETVPYTALAPHIIAFTTAVPPLPLILSPKNHNSSKQHIDPFYLVEPLLSLLAGLNPSSGV